MPQFATLLILLHPLLYVYAILVILLWELKFDGMLKLLSGRGVDSISLYTNVSNKADIHGKFNKITNSILIILCAVRIFKTSTEFLSLSRNTLALKLFFLNPSVSGRLSNRMNYRTKFYILKLV